MSRPFLPIAKSERVAFHRGVDRTTPGKNIIEFREAFDTMYLVMKHEAMLETLPLWNTLKRPRNVFGFEVNIIILADNIILIVALIQVP